MTTTEPNPQRERKDGRVVAIAGPVIDVEFPRGSLPELNRAIEFTALATPVSDGWTAWLTRTGSAANARVIASWADSGCSTAAPVLET